MKLQPLYDLQQEINRLFIAGSKFAQGDPRLQKHIPILNKLGEKAPVFKKLATDIEDLIQSDTQQAADKLRTVSTLLYSVLYTQGETVETDVEEEIQIPVMDIRDVSTEHSYLQLKPVIEALTHSNSGRLEILKDAFERKIFEDSRTWYYLNFALADKYAELVDYVEKTIIPSITKPLIPFLLQSFRYEDKAEQARRLRLLNQLGYAEIPAMTEKILSESLPSLQAEAVTILSDNPANEALIIQLADDKNKIVREAAYKALAKLNTRASLEKLTDVYIKNKNKANLPMIVNALASTKLPFFFQEVFNQVSASFEDFIALDKNTEDKVLVEKFGLFQTHLDALMNKADDRIYHFLEYFIQNKPYEKLISTKKNLLENKTFNLSYDFVNILKSFDNDRQLAFYEKQLNDSSDADWKNPFWNHYLYTAFYSGYPKEKFFNLFNAPVIKERISIRTIYNLFLNKNKSENRYFNQGESLVENEQPVFSADRIDARWIEYFYNYIYDSLNKKPKWTSDHELILQIIHTYYPDNYPKFDKLLAELTVSMSPEDCIEIFRLMMERKRPDRFQIIFTSLEKLKKNSYYHYSLKNAGFWNQFPKEYKAKFKKLYEQNNLQIFEEIADEISE
jgi:hypothetical protein